MIALAACAVVFLFLLIAGWLLDVVAAFFLLILAFFVDLWDRIFPPGPPANP